jgi:predicted dehydrogenase
MPAGGAVRIGIVGAAGGRMTFSHLPNLASNPRAAFRAFCDLDVPRAERVAAERGYRVGYFTADLDRLLADEEVDLLVAGLPHEVHREVILRACEARKDLFIEKPMVLSPAECAEVLDAVESSGIRLMVGHNRRFAPTFADARRIYRGQMRAHPAVLSYRVADPLPYLYRERPAGGRIYGEMCHFFDLFAWFLGVEPVRIYTEGDLNDFHITIAFDGGSRGVLTSSASGGMGYPKELFECFADDQSVVVEGNMCLTHSGACGQVTVTTYPLFLDPYPGLPGTLDGYRQRMANYAKDQFEGKFAAFSHPSGYKGHYEELDACIDAILLGQPFPANEVDGARAIVCCEAALQSSLRGVPVTVDRAAYMR